MIEMEKKLEVRNLKISFRTINGKVQAVREIDFDLYKGETLAIVGESGSGKSVTSRAILGILAPNAIVEGGEILYDDKDLMKISEEDFHSIRGDKISMIFQDPLSSLNPIMRIGQQMTEAMLLKNKAKRRSSRKELNSMFALLLQNMNSAMKGQSGADKENSEKIEKFKKFEYHNIHIEDEFNRAYEGVLAALPITENLIFNIGKNIVDKIGQDISEIRKFAGRSYHRFVVNARSKELRDALDKLRGISSELSSSKKKAKDYTTLLSLLNTIKAILTEAKDAEKPNFFGLAFYQTYCGKDIPDVSVEELNELTHEKLNNEFMLDFIRSASEGVKYSFDRAIENKAAAVKMLDGSIAVFEGQDLNRKEVFGAVKAISEVVKSGIDKLDVSRDSHSYTFESSITSAVCRYFDGIDKNAKEKIRFEKQTAKYEDRVARGRKPEWSVVPADYVNIEVAKDNIIKIIRNMSAHLREQISIAGETDFSKRTVAVINWLKDTASAVVYRVTHAMAKEYAIKLMESVGITEARKRYRQYPFQFSGGMRQRIVIAIALTANPDILICDEPTTALDVTIQAQILELINKIKKERNLSIIFITHDLGVVANMADRIAVMYAGKIVEYGTSYDVFYHPAHPYTWALLSSMPDFDTKERLETIPGTPPNMIYPPKGDAFSERNPHALQIDFEMQPPMFRISDTHYASTWLLHPDAPKVDPPKLVTDRIARMAKKREEEQK